MDEFETMPPATQVRYNTTTPKLEPVTDQSAKIHETIKQLPAHFMNNVPKFNGDPTKLSEFKRQATMLFAYNGEYFPTAERKIAFIVTRLEKRAMSWAYSLLENLDPKHPIFHDEKEYLKSLSEHIRTPAYMAQARHKWNSFKQDTKMSVTEYYDAIQELSQLLELSNPEAWQKFHEGLLPAIHAQLRPLRTPTYNWSRLHEDAHYAENAYQEQVVYGQNALQQTMSTPIQYRNYQAPPTQNYPTNPTTTTGIFGTIPQGGNQPSGPRGPISLEEKNRRRREGLCLYCGKTGHINADCQLRIRNQQQRNTVAATAQDPHFFQGQGTPATNPRMDDSIMGHPVNPDHPFSEQNQSAPQ